MMRLAVVGVLLLTGSAQALDVDLDAYRGARRIGALGVVEGRVAAEPRTLRAPAQPLTGSTVVLLPRSEALLKQLEELKDGSRNSSSAFTGAATAMRKAREAYERRLWEAGAPELTPATLVDGDGAFRITDVPAGAWLLCGWQSVPVNVSGERVRARERTLFRPHSRLRGFQSVTIWLNEVTVAAGATSEVQLTDRNIWFRGVVEERITDPGR
jgi:hypothetical protein